MLTGTSFTDIFNMKKIWFFIFITGLFFISRVAAQSLLLIRSSDIRLEQDGTAGFDSAGGFHLYIRKKSGINSIMLTETTKDPEGRADNYAYRSLEWNNVNGDEQRMLNGKILESPYSKFSLIDSTPEKDPVFGESFHIYIPRKLQYGYPWSRHGTIDINRWTFINIRSFSSKYEDYRGNFFDNPFMFDLGKVPEKKVERPDSPVLLPMTEPVVKEIPVLTDDYNPVASQKFQEISDFMIYSKGPETIVNDIMSSIARINPKNKADVVFAIDTTGSMKDDVEQLRKEWVPRLVEGLKEFKHVRLGLILYRDYGDALYNYQNIPVKFFDFTDDVLVFTKNLNGFKIYGNEGGDIPEAVYEGLYAALEFYQWDAEAQRKVILIGDAEPHPKPRGSKKYTKKLIQQIAADKKITIDAIILPDNKTDRGR
jgi:hypothetical protein